MSIIGRDRFHHGQVPTSTGRTRREHASASTSTGQILLLVGMEGPDLTDPATDKPFWHPTGADPRWRRLVKQALIEFLTRNTQDEWRWDATSADVAVFRNAAEFSSALRRRRYARVVVYSHGDPFALMAKIEDSSTHVRAYALAKALAEAGVRRALLLGCNSRALAETVARITEGFVRAGGIDYIRQDYVDDHKTRLDILNPIIWGYGGSP